MMQPRIEQRRGMEVESRVQLLEADMDRDDLEKESLRRELSGIRRVLVGILVSVSTAAVLFAANLLFEFAKNA